MAVYSELLKNLGSLSDEELQELMSRAEVEKSRREQPKDTKGLIIENGTVVSCPHCGSVTVTRHGKTQGQQRYRCKDCKKTFIQTTGTIFSHSKLDIHQWREIIKGMIQGLSYAKIADVTELTPAAVWGNCQKIYALLANVYKEQDKFEGIAEFDEKILRLSFKGKRDPEFFVKTLGRMPRHHRTLAEKRESLEKYGLLDELEQDPTEYDNVIKGDKFVPLSNEDEVSVLTGRDRSGHYYIDPVCIGNIESKHVVAKLTGRISSDEIMVTDGSNSYKWFAQLENIQHEVVLSKEHARGPYNLARVNALHNKIEGRYDNDKGRLPATKYLDLNLMFFWWLEENSELDIKQQIDKLMELISNQSNATALYKDLSKRPLPIDTKGQLPPDA